MLEIQETSRFKKDMKRLSKRGKDFSKLRGVVQLLAAEQALAPANEDHKLGGSYVGHRECHLESNWLLIYRYNPGVLTLVRTGTHSDLFKK